MSPRTPRCSGRVSAAETKPKQQVQALRPPATFDLRLVIDSRGIRRKCSVRSCRTSPGAATHVTSAIISGGRWTQNASSVSTSRFTISVENPVARARVHEEAGRPPFGGRPADESKARRLRRDQPPLTIGHAERNRGCRATVALDALEVDASTDARRQRSGRQIQERP